MSARGWAWLRMFAGVLVLVFLAVRLGAEPFLDGLRSTEPGIVLVALVITAITTACCAWRWSLLSRRLDLPVPMRTAYGSYYRSQLLNATLPSGVLGDVHRGLDHGRSSGALARGLRSVVWDRVSGQVVQVALAVAALALLPSAVRNDVGRILAALVAGCVLLVVLLPRRLRRATLAEARTVTADRATLLRVTLTSALAALGHAGVFVVVARSAGVDVPLPELAALALVVLLASSVPLSVAGWGPREGAAAWLFADAGIGAATGLAVSVTYGVVALVAVLPGLAFLAGRAPRAGEWEPTGKEVSHG